MSAARPPSPAILSAKTQKEVTSVRARKAIYCKMMEEAVKILTSVQPNNTTASSCVSTPSVALHVNVPLDSPSTILPALITMNVLLTSTCVALRAFAKILLGALPVNVNEDSLLIRVEAAVKMWMSVKETIAASMAARISLEATGAAAPRAIFNTTSGTSVSMRMNV